MVKDPKEPRATLVLKDPLDLPDQQGLRDHKEQRVTPELLDQLDLLVQPDLLDQPVHKAPRDRRVLQELLVFLQQALHVTHVDSRTHQMMEQKG